jgi:hypothetical protein
MQNNRSLSLIAHMRENSNPTGASAPFVISLTICGNSIRLIITGRTRISPRTREPNKRQRALLF